ncbi:MAG: hypothetical protein K1000chlam3_00317 [Chlamydiae bacterium]|nr:hypothetical protein [Chlamydiota bacterium]
MIAGTSTGGILGLGLSLPDPHNPKRPKYTAKEVLDFYVNPKFSKRIFQVPQPPKTCNTGKIDLTDIKFDGEFYTLQFPDLPKSKLLSDPRIAGLQLSIDDESTSFSAHVLGAKIVKLKRKNNALQISSDFEIIRQQVQPKYSAEGIEGVLKERFGNLRLSQLLPIEVFATSFNTSKMKHQLWSKFHAERRIAPDIPVWQAARASSAAPTYFPAFDISQEEFIDGGVCMNNPTLELIFQALRMGYRREDLFCVSLGTGEFLKPLASTKHFGTVHWAKSIFNTACFGSSSQVDSGVKTMLEEEQYVRIQVDLSEEISLDSGDLKNISKLEKIAADAIQKNAEKFNKIHSILKKVGKCY